MFFLQALPVSAARFRPASKMGQQIFENTRSVKLTDVLKACQSIRDFQANGGARNAAGPRLDNDEFNTKLLPIWNNLQLCVNVVVDAGLDTRAGAEPVGGVKQVLEKKEGVCLVMKDITDDSRLINKDDFRVLGGARWFKPTTVLCLGTGLAEYRGCSNCHSVYDS